MKKSLLAPTALISVLLQAPILVAQPEEQDLWTEEQLEKAIRGFLRPTTKAQLEQMASLLKAFSNAKIRTLRGLTQANQGGSVVNLRPHGLSGEPRMQLCCVGVRPQRPLDTPPLFRAP